MPGNVSTQKQQSTEEMNTDLDPELVRSELNEAESSAVPGTNASHGTGSRPQRSEARERIGD
jgi:hypothetical protein